MSDQIEQIGVDVIDDPHEPMRSAMDEEKLDELMRSIERHGLMQPITLRKVGQRYEIVAGHRRYTAMRRLGKALIPAVVRELDDAKADELRMAENLYREDINPVDEARYIRKMVETHKVEPAQLAEMTGKSEAYLTARYELLDFPPYLIEALEKEQIGLTAAQSLNRITDDRVRAEYTRFAILGGITAVRARAWYESWKAGNLPREASEYQHADGETSAEPLPIYDTCVLCRTRDDITSMRMHYGHDACAAAAARAIQPEKPGEA